MMFLIYPLGPTHNTLNLDYTDFHNYPLNISSSLLLKSLAFFQTFLILEIDLRLKEGRAQWNVSLHCADVFSLNIGDLYFDQQTHTKHNEQSQAPPGSGDVQREKNPWPSFPGVPFTKKNANKNRTKDNVHGQWIALDNLR